VSVGVALVLSLFQFLRAGRTELNAAIIPILMALWLAHGFFVDINWMEHGWLLVPLAVFIYRSYVATTPTSPLKDAIISGLLAAIPVAWGIYNAFQHSTTPVQIP
jgi:hypothetical protein